MMPVPAIKAIAAVKSVVGVKDVVIVLVVLFIGYKLYSFGYERGANKELLACAKQQSVVAAEHAERLSAATSRYRDAIRRAREMAASEAASVSAKLDRADKRADSGKVCFSKREIREIWK